MRIAVVSNFYRPSVGGVQASAALLADIWARDGHEVAVMTSTANAELGPSVKNAGAVEWRKLTRLARQSDTLIWHDPLPRQLLMATVLPRVVVVLHRRSEDAAGRSRWRHRLSLVVIRWARRVQRVAVSTAIAAEVGGVNTVIPPPLDPLFLTPPTSRPRDRDIIFSGRLVSGKGVEELLEALGRLRAAGRRLTATIIGNGPLEAALSIQVRRLGLEEAVRFLGMLSHTAVRDELDRHRVAVLAPTRFEAFGLSALEGLARGCVPVLRDVGGIRDAVQCCGVFTRANAPLALDEALITALDAPPPFTREVVNSALTAADLRTVADRYLQCFKRACAADGGSRR